MTMLRPRRTTTTTTSREAGFADTHQDIRNTPLPYTMASSASADNARQQVQHLVEGLLPDGVDEGTGAALDRLIASWTAEWLAGIDAEHADHTAAIDRLIGAAREQVADARAEYEHRAFRLEIARQEQVDARLRLGGTPPQSTRSQSAAIGDGIDPAEEVR